MAERRTRAKPGPKPRATPLASLASAAEFVRRELGAETSKELLDAARKQRDNHTSDVLGDVAQEIRLRTKEEALGFDHLAGFGWHVRALQHQLRMLASADLSAVLTGDRARQDLATYESYMRWVGVLNALESEVNPSGPLKTPEGRAYPGKEQRAFAESLLRANGGATHLTGLVVAALAVLFGIDPPAMCSKCSEEWEKLKKRAASTARGSEWERKATDFVCGHPDGLEVKTRLREDLWRKHVKRLREQLADNAP